MTTTLNKIRKHSPYKGSWEKLLKYLGKTKADDEELDLLTILDNMGIEFAIWCLRAVDGYDTEIQVFTHFCRMYNLTTLKPHVSEYDYNLIKEWIETGNEDLRIPAELAIHVASPEVVWAHANSTEEAEVIAEAMVALKNITHETELRRILKV